MDFIAKDSAEGAASIARSALDLAASLATLSERGRIVPELQETAIREVFTFRYRLMYRVDADQVVILAFIHGARDFERWRRETSE